MKKFALCLLLAFAGQTHAQSRADTNEWSLNLFIVGPKNYVFEGGASARNDGGGGIGLTLAHNLNDYFAVGLDATLSEFGYRANVAPGAGNAAAGFQSEGSMETAALVSSDCGTLSRATDKPGRKSILIPISARVGKRRYDLRARHTTSCSMTKENRQP